MHYPLGHYHYLHLTDSLFCLDRLGLNPRGYRRPVRPKPELGLLHPRAQRQPPRQKRSRDFSPAVDRDFDEAGLEVGLSAAPPPHSTRAQPEKPVLGTGQDQLSGKLSMIARVNEFRKRTELILSLFLGTPVVSHHHKWQRELFPEPFSTAHEALKCPR